MKINADKSLCFKKEIYKDYNYWEYIVSSGNCLFDGHFNNLRITEHSKIIYTGFLNSQKNVMQCGFAVYPSIYSLLGFIQNIFLSTSFFTWCDKNTDSFCIPMATFDAVVSEICSDTSVNKEIVNAFNDSYDFLNSLWDFDDKPITLELINFAEKFNNKWDKDPSKKLFIKIFDSPEEIYHFIMATIGWDFDEFLEEEIDMDKETLKTTCESVLAEPFINEKFIDILNTNIPILF